MFRALSVVVALLLATAIPAAHAEGVAPPALAMASTGQIHEQDTRPAPARG